MYEILLTTQFVGVVIVIFVILSILSRPNSKGQLLLLIMSMAVLVNTVGYSMEMQARTKETALMAVKIIYLGKPFIQMAMIFALTDYFHEKMNRVIEYILILYGVGIAGLVLTCEKQNLFYSSIDYSEEGLFPHLVLGHGPFYMMYLAMVAGLVCYAFFLLIKNRNQEKSRNEKIQISLLYTMMILCVAGIVAFLLGITGGYDTTSIAYIISCVLLSIALEKYQLLDAVGLAKEEMLEQMADGLVVVDNNSKVRYANSRAEQVFADIKLKEDSGKEAVERLQKLAKGGPFKWEESVYEVLPRDIEYKDQKLGVMYAIQDITDRFLYAERLQEEVEKKTANLQRLQRNVTLGLADIIESRDIDTGGHVRRTSEVIHIFMQKLAKSKAGRAYSDDFFANVINAAPMHDLGKIGISDLILNKPGKFTAEEYEQMKTHPAKGAPIIERILQGTEDEEFKKVAINIAHFHHEKWDGSGYPLGLSGEEIPVEARIMALADVFDALVSRRCYKEKMSFEEAFQIIRESLGSHFDKELGECFIACRPELEKYYENTEEA